MVLWIPNWLGKIYSRLYTRFWGEAFTFREATEHLGLDDNTLSVAFSKLHSKRILLIIDAGRPRLYRLIRPENLILLASEVTKNFESIPQERYVNLICDAFREIYRAFDLTSFAVYGSVARGEAGEDSDVDILVVSNDFTGSVSSRIDALSKLDPPLNDELAWLRGHGTHTGLSYRPMREEEAEAMPLLFLDMTEEAVILYDRGRLLERVLTELKARLLRMGAKRVITEEGGWYWDLKPDYEFGEVIRI